MIETKNSDVSVVLPSYKPDDKLISCVNSLKDAGFDDIIVVDDGGGDEYNKYFDTVRSIEGCTVLVHPENRGKGAALKTAFAWYIENRDGCGVVTVDGDGQHRPEDVRACADRLCDIDEIVIGVRDFSSDLVPARSAFGNKFSCAFFRLFVGMKISDTQTGLRAIPAKYLSDMCKINGDRYEYETNMLLYIQRHSLTFEEIKINTVYIDDNESSHFRPFRDSARIYLLVFKHLLTSSFVLFLCSSLVSYILDMLMFVVLDKVLSPIDALASLAGGVVLTFATYGVARFVSSLLNFSLNRLIFHRQGGSVLKTMVKYYLLVVFNLVVGSISVYLILTVLSKVGFVSNIFNAISGKASPTALKSIVKAVVDAVLYFCSYNVQKHIVFKKKDERRTDV